MLAVVWTLSTGGFGVGAVTLEKCVSLARFIGVKAFRLGLIRHSSHWCAFQAIIAE